MLHAASISHSRSPNKQIQQNNAHARYGDPDLRNLPESANKLQSATTPSPTATDEITDTTSASDLELTAFENVDTALSKKEPNEDTLSEKDNLEKTNLEEVSTVDESVSVGTVDMNTSKKDKSNSPADETSKTKTKKKKSSKKKTEKKKLQPLQRVVYAKKKAPVIRGFGSSSVGRSAPPRHKANKVTKQARKSATTTSVRPASHTRRRSSLPSKILAAEIQDSASSNSIDSISTEKTSVRRRSLPSKALKMLPSTLPGNSSRQSSPVPPSPNTQVSEFNPKPPRPRQPTVPRRRSVGMVSPGSLSMRRSVPGTNHFPGAPVPPVATPVQLSLGGPNDALSPRQRQLLSEHKHQNKSNNLENSIADKAPRHVFVSDSSPTSPSTLGMPGHSVDDLALVSSSYSPKASEHFKRQGQPSNRAFFNVNSTPLQQQQTQMKRRKSEYFTSSPLQNPVVAVRRKSHSSASQHNVRAEAETESLDRSTNGFAAMMDRRRRSNPANLLNIPRVRTTMQRRSSIGRGPHRMPRTNTLSASLDSLAQPRN